MTIENIKKRYRKSKRGFTLVEVLMAATMFAVGMIGIISLFPAALLQSQNTKDDATAVTVGQSAISYLKGRNFTPSDAADGQFWMLHPRADNNGRMWVRSFTNTGAGYIGDGTHNESFFPETVGINHKGATNKFEEGDRVRMPFLLNPSELIYWPTGPAINIRTHNVKYLNDQIVVGYDNAHRVETSNRIGNYRLSADVLQDPSLVWTFGYYRASEASPANLFVFVYKPQSMDLKVDTDSIDNLVSTYNQPDRNRLETQGFDVDDKDGNEIVNATNFPWFLVPENNKNAPMVLRINGAGAIRSSSYTFESGQAEVHTQLKRGQYLLCPETGSVYEVINSWNPDLNATQNLRMMFSAADYERMFRVDIPTSTSVRRYIGFPVALGDNAGNSIKPLGIFVGTLQD